MSRRLGDTKFITHNLVVDPLQGAVQAQNVDDFIGQLSRDLLTGRYTPRPGVILRSAKKLGMTRPVCSLHPRDALVYRAIVRLAEDELLRGVPAWVGFQRADKAPEATDDSQSIDWFERWMRHEGMLPNLASRPEIELVVQSDISNFFPSVRMDVVREHLANNTSLDATLVRLCCQIIGAVHPRLDYADDSFLGLPQEIHDASRTIAQAILKPIDDEFGPMGTDGRYSRFMDDVLWGVADLREATEVVARFQARLEPLGLYPNASKTRISTKDDFVKSYMVSTNAELDKLDELIKPLFKSGRIAGNPPKETLQTLNSIAASHRRSRSRPDRWPRVSRRLYTLQRRLGVDTWIKHWPVDFAQDPGGGSTYFEYMRAWPLTLKRIDVMDATVRGFFGLYADIEVMFAETIATAPVAGDTTLWSSIFEFCSKRFVDAAKHGQEPVQASAWFVAAAKYGNKAQRALLVEDARKWCAAQAPRVVVQAAALDQKLMLRRVLPASVFGTDEVLAAAFFTRTSESDTRSLGVIKALLDPVSVLAPVRAIIRPRALLLLDRLGESAGHDPRLLANYLTKIRSNPDRLRDHRTEALLSEWAT